MNQIQKLLFAEQDGKYKDFISRLVPNVSEDNIIGVRMPKIRLIAKNVLKDSKTTDEFLSDLPHIFHEENLLHSCILSGLKDLDRVLKEIDSFLPYVDNWAVCDSLSVKSLVKKPEDLDKLYGQVFSWINSKHEYSVRFAFVVLLNNFVDSNFDPKHLGLMFSVLGKQICEEYYVKMAIAWYISFLLIKNYNQVVSVLEEGLLPVWVHNKSIQKAIESYQISDERKAYLKTLRKKK